MVEHAMVSCGQWAPQRRALYQELSLVELTILEGQVQPEAFRSFCSEVLSVKESKEREWNREVNS